MKNKILRRILYAGSVSIFGILSIVMFVVATNIKTEYSHNSEVSQITGQINKIETDYKETPEVYTEESGEKYAEYEELQEQLAVLAKKYDTNYTICSVTGFVSSILTLVSFGVILKVSDKVKEKEDNEVQPLVPPSGEGK